VNLPAEEPLPGDLLPERLEPTRQLVSADRAGSGSRLRRALGSDCVISPRFERHERLRLHANYAEARK
jgi:hypothetical protein